ncbi:MAG: FtsW/RodA/SpoVE family cell cycle protein [Prevotellaceae bacterium]|jgi:cell division protein FtsW|nr:FtsW/RodA/SpoVE family cell cycle protein [Prevotellaceae bacterium]
MTEQTVKPSFWRTLKGDKGIWVIILLLSLISLVAVYSSTYTLAYRQGRIASFFLLKQFGSVMIGLAVLYICHRIPLGWYRKFSLLGLLVSIGLLVATLIFGKTINDGTRWLTIAGFTFQSTEIAKIALILYVAVTIETRKLDTFKEYSLYLLLPVAVVCLLLLWGSNSAVILLGGTVYLVLIVAGTKLKRLLITFGLIVVSLVIIVSLAKYTPLFPRIETAIKRIDGKNQYQAIHAKIAVASAGIVGKGPGNSTQRILLPHPYSDFIYATIVEEYGLLGGSVILLLFLWFFYRTCRIAKQCTRISSILLVVGLGMLIAIQAIIHMGVNVGLFPVTGQTLPLVSMGGTSFVVICAAFGMILAVSRTVEKKQVEDNMEVAW